MITRHIYIPTRARWCTHFKLSQHQRGIPYRMCIQCILPVLLLFSVTRRWHCYLLLYRKPDDFVVAQGHSATPAVRYHTTCMHHLSIYLHSIYCHSARRAACRLNACIDVQDCVSTTTAICSSSINKSSYQYSCVSHTVVHCWQLQCC